MGTLQRKIGTAGDLQSVVRAMKALAASNILQYESAVRALADYYRTVALGLSVCLRHNNNLKATSEVNDRTLTGAVGAIVFGSDQGLAGQFNEVISVYAIKSLKALRGEAHVWAVGERVHASLEDAGLQMMGLFSVPASVQGIAPLVTQIQIESEAQRAKGDYEHVFVFHNRPKTGGLFEPVSQRLLPLDASWQKSLTETPWPTRNLPEVLWGTPETLSGFIREYLFISLFRACAESLASENESRLAAMERADRNIDELIESLHGSFHRLRQSGIDEELFDVISGYEALSQSGQSI
jgi:F-type H+-transporting ATPase subunit gamma